MARQAKAQVEAEVPEVAPEAAEAAPEVAAAEAVPERRYVILSRRIDKNNEIRKRVLLTESVCERCGVDFAVAEDDGLPAEQRTRAVRKRIEAHQRQVHSAAEVQILRESELPREWLSGRNR